MTSYEAIVVGGGISGLTAARALQNAGKSVLVLEERERPGGNVHTVELDGGYRVESGPHSFMGSAEFLWQLVEDVGLLEKAEKASAIADNRYIYRDGRLTPLPLGAWKFITSRLLSFKGKWSLAMEPFKKPVATPGETAWDFFVRRFGEEAATYIMSPFISGVYAGDIHQLGAREAFNKFWVFENEGGSMIRGAMKYMKAKRRRFKDEGKELRKGLYSVQGGLGNLSAAVAESLADRVGYNAGVEAIEQDGDGYRVKTSRGEFHGKTLVVSVPPGKASQALSYVNPSAAQLMADIPMVPVALAHWAVKAEDGAFPPGFGFLVPRVTGVRLLGTLFPSQLFTGRAPEGHHLMASYYGGALDREAAEMPDEELKTLLVKEHEEILGRELEELTLFHVMRVQYAIPQLVPGHLERIEKIMQELQYCPGVFLAGNYLNGVGIENAAQSGYEGAAQVVDFLDGGKGE